PGAYCASGVVRHGRRRSGAYAGLLDCDATRFLPWRIGGIRLAVPGGLEWPYRFYPVHAARFKSPVPRPLTDAARYLVVNAGIAGVRLLHRSGAVVRDVAVLRYPADGCVSQPAP